MRTFGLIAHASHVNMLVHTLYVQKMTETVLIGRELNIIMN